MLLATATLQEPLVQEIGRVTAIYWPGHEVAAASLAERANDVGEWPGLNISANYRIRLIVAPNQRVMDSVTAGRVPPGRAGVAFPGQNLIVLVAGPTQRQVLQHELAHLALRRVVRRAPLWFDEGYASRAAGEWNRLTALKINWALVSGRVPSLIDLNRDIRLSGARAEAAYALATTAVLLLERLGGDRGLEPLLDNMAREPTLDLALRRTYQITIDQFETLWKREVKQRYGWLQLMTSLTLFWAVVSILMLGVWFARRRREQDRRAALDDGWVVDTQEPPAS